MTTNTTPAIPRAFPIEEVQKLSKTLLFATNEAELIERLDKSSQETPIIITTKLATELLGWENFK